MEQMQKNDADFNHQDPEFEALMEMFSEKWWSGAYS